MINEIGEPAMLEMLAEELVECAHEVLKLARVLRCENPTPKTMAIAMIGQPCSFAASGLYSSLVKRLRRLSDDYTVRDSKGIRRGLLVR